MSNIPATNCVVWYVRLCYNIQEFKESQEEREIAVKKVKQLKKKTVDLSAVQTIEEQLRNYELVLIYKPELDEEKLKLEIENIGKIATGRGGSMEEPEYWGKRRLAYPIKGAMEGSYVLLNIKTKPFVTKELIEGFRISENILRHLLINLKA